MNPQMFSTCTCLSMTRGLFNFIHSKQECTFRGITWLIFGGYCSDLTHNLNFAFGFRSCLTHPLRPYCLAVQTDDASRRPELCWLPTQVTKLILSLVSASVHFTVLHSWCSDYSLPFGWQCSLNVWDFYSSVQSLEKRCGRLHPQSS